MTLAARLLAIDDLVALLATDPPPVVLDVRDLIESEHGHIPGATILPRRRIEFRIEALVRDRTTPLVVVDGGDATAEGPPDPRAALAADTLAALGYRDVRALAGGLAAWRRAGLPVVSGAQVSSKAFGRRIGDLERVPTIGVDTLRRWQGDGRRVALCDVRSADEHTEGCVPGAVSLPGFEVALHALDMVAEADAIVLCSSARTRSLMAARTLIDLGLDDVFALEGGALAWRLAGHELEQGSRRRRVRPSRPARQFAQLGAARLAKHFGVERVEAADLAALLFATSGNFHAFDLRAPGQHLVAHVPRSVSVANDRLIVRHEELIGARDAPVVLIDDDPVRALLTGVWLRRLGLPRVRKLAGGFAAWSLSGRPASTVSELPLGWHEASAVTPGLAVDDVGRWLAAYEPARVLHVDTSTSYRRGHLPGATWLPRGWLETRIAQVAPSLEDALLLTCADGAQAAFAAATLRGRGHVHVAWLQGGTRIWAASGRTLETSALPPQDDELLPPARREEQEMRDYLDWERLAAPRGQA
jgi:rhodanese-related sulfurtransferase